MAKTRAAIGVNAAALRAARQEYRAKGLCVVCGEPATVSNRSKDGKSQWCQKHLQGYRDYLSRRASGGRLRFTSAEIELLRDAIVEYRKLAIQCSNTTFNFAQRMRGENGQAESCHQLVRDYDRAENRLIEVLKDTGLFKSLSEGVEQRPV